MAFHFTWKPDLTAVATVLATVERALLPLGGRPHRGKLTLSGHAASSYERLPDFLALCRALDPAGKFGNRFTDTLAGSEG